MGVDKFFSTLNFLIVILLLLRCQRSQHRKSFPRLGQRPTYLKTFPPLHVVQHCHQPRVRVKVRTSNNESVQRRLVELGP